jgi:hypothetical protein
MPKVKTETNLVTEETEVLNCLQYATDDKPVYELAGSSAVYGVTLPSKRWYMVYMKPCSDQKKIRALYEKVGGSVLKAAQGDEVSMLGTDKSACIPFFARQFEIMNSSSNKPMKNPATREDQLTWMAEHPKMGIEETVVMQCVLSLEIEEPEDTEEVDDLSVEEESNIKTIARLVDTTTCQVVKVPIVWKLRDVSEHENRRWQKATGETKMHTKKWTFQKKVDHNTVEDLFKSLVYQADGCVINGVACCEANVKDWAGKVNYGWMYLLMNYVFRGSAAKNE